MAGRRFVILDRDGTVIVEKNYLADPDGVELLPGAADALCRLRALGLGLVLVTNQSGIGRGYFRAEQADAVHARLRELLSERGVHLDGIYMCPHAPDAGCDCRKPRTGLLVRAAADLDFDPADGFVVGDKAADMEMGRRAGAVTVFVRTGQGREQESAASAFADHVVDTLADAADRIQETVSTRSA